MAPFSSPPMVLPLLVFLLAAEAAAASATGGSLTQAPYTRVFAFGNSLTDTGNAAIFPATAKGPSSKPPYGQTYFGHPSGRSSDGRLIIDFLVKELEVPLPTPYLAGRTAADFLNGANFALGGATALDPAFLASRGITSAVPISLSNETIWFGNVLQLISSSGYDQRKIMARSILFVGEIGVNDYFFAIMTKSIQVAESLVPHIVGTIRSALTAMIGAGARTVVVTGMLPLGCEPKLLAMFPGATSGYEPASGCDARFNKLAVLHNRALKLMLSELRLRYPGRSLVYADVYRPIMRAVSSPARYGFGSTPLVTCCGGGGGPYNFNYAAFCGTPKSTTCEDPSEFISWDGIHFTEAANELMAHAVLRGVMSPEAEPASSQQA